jgi:hypothetical protein
MRLICPSCGATHSAEAWDNDAQARAVVEIVAALPREVARWSLHYLALFRPQGRALSWTRARRLLEALRALVEASEMVWAQEAPRPNDPRAWAAAMEQLCAHPPRTLPLANHNYLRRMAYSLAGRAAAGHEEAPRPATVEELKREYEGLDEAALAENRRRIQELLRGVVK